ncbi:HdeD family acid-resistance protein [Mammaliicoccus sciuri]|uniref:HdeD family acid-resistance protein n=1 Tax=Mammaliicoccus sciuri TaxID=1296 RepID=A0AAI8DJP5_MAMSC|nr:DUF308 domain-containing protein [Mammaliicoccus sciuri]ASE35718.1 hypothetical protein CEP64_13955 [Mammaliicoccus sciuri]MEB7784177.1 DUF308 domain-containing protein [Mammaliicoccus sciuri]
MKNFKWFSLVSGSIFILIGILCFLFPLESIKNMFILIGIFLIFNGILEIFVFQKLKEIINFSRFWSILLGVLHILTGLFIIMNLEASFVVLSYILSIWFILSSISNIYKATPLEKSNKLYHSLSILLNILGIAIGIILLFNPFIVIVLISFLISCYFIIFGLSHIIYALAK